MLYPFKMFCKTLLKKIKLLFNLSRLKHLGANFIIMNLQNLGVQEMNTKELVGVDGGRGWWRFVAELAKVWIEYAQSDDCPAGYDNHEDVGGMGFPICA